MAEVRDGIAKPEALSEFMAIREERNDISKKLEVLDDEILALKDKRKRFVDRLYEIEKKCIYDAAMKIVNAHKYWAMDEKFSAVAKVDKIETEGYVKFLVSGEEGVDKPHSSSCAGVLYKYPVPITEEKYNKVHSWYKWKLGK